MDKFIIQWHITHICNLRCKHCYQEEYSYHMPRKSFYKILDKFEDYFQDKDIVPQINLTGGEPLLHPDFFELAQEIRKRNIKLGILTNGTLIDDEVAKRLSDLAPVFVQVSLDGVEQTHDKIRGVGNFRKALNGISSLKKHNVRVLVSFTAQKSNYKEFDQLAAICKKYRVDKLWWDRVVTDDANQFLSTKEFAEISSACNSIIHSGSLFHKPSFVSNCRSLQFIDTNGAGYQCQAGKSLLAILADGTVMPCRRLPIVVGNILTDSMEKICQSSTVRSLRSFCGPKECLGCKDYIKCKGGSKCVTYAQTGQWNMKDINCPYN